jgi:hypothetical protein
VKKFGTLRQTKQGDDPKRNGISSGRGHLNILTIYKKKKDI